MQRTHNKLVLRLMGNLPRLARNASEFRYLCPLISDLGSSLILDTYLPTPDTDPGPLFFSVVTVV